LTLVADTSIGGARVVRELDTLVARYGKQIVVAPVMTDSTCAIAASYEAKAFGIKTGTPIIASWPSLALTCKSRMVWWF